MSKIALEGNASGTGTFTVAAPNSNSNYTLTLPQSTGTVVVTGGAQTIEFAAGTVSTPSITFTGDTNTGIFSPAADTIAFTEGGVEAMRITSAGDVGIGTSSPASKLDVTQSGATRITVVSTNNDASGSGINFLVKNAGVDVGNGTIRIDNADNMQFFNIGGERARITSGGELLVGTTSAANTNAKIRSSSGIQYNNSVLLDVSNPNGKVFTITGGSNGQSTFVEIEIITYEGYFKAVYFCINAGGDWENDKYNEVTSGTPATVTVAGNNSATLTLTVACTASFTPLMRVAMGSTFISLS